MERVDQPNENVDHESRDTQQKGGGFFRGRSIIGLMVIIAGSAWLVHRMGYEFAPHWLFTWPTLLIAVGFASGIKHRFKNPGAFITMLVGAAFLVHNNFDIPYELKTYFWPVVVIIGGIFLLFKPKQNKCGPQRYKHYDYYKNNYSDQDKTAFQTKEGIVDSSPFMDSVIIFGGAERDVIAKDFAGGDCAVIFGGNQINFAKADLAPDARLELTIIFGGMKLIVPPHWDVQVNTTNIAGGIDDKRRRDTSNTEHKKTLTLTGTIVFGGLEIRSSNQI